MKKEQLFTTHDQQLQIFFKVKNAVIVSLISVHTQIETYYKILPQGKLFTIVIYSCNQFFLNKKNNFLHVHLNNT